MEGVLEDPPSALWTSIDHCRAMELILSTLQVIAVALYLDPVNSDFFQKHDLFEKIAEDLGLLGCFSAPKSQQIPVSLHKTRSFAEFSSAVCSSEYFPTWLKSCITILTFFDHMAKGNCIHFKNNLVETNVSINELSMCIQEAKENETNETEDGCEKTDNNKIASSLWPESKNKYVLISIIYNEAKALMMFLVLYFLGLFKCHSKFALTPMLPLLCTVLGSMVMAKPG